MVMTSCGKSSRYGSKRVLKTGDLSMHHLRHCERSEAIQLSQAKKAGLLRRYAPRNDAPPIVSALFCSLLESPQHGVPLGDGFVQSLLGGFLARQRRLDFLGPD